MLIDSTSTLPYCSENVLEQSVTTKERDRRCASSILLDHRSEQIKEYIPTDISIL